MSTDVQGPADALVSARKTGDLLAARDATRGPNAVHADGHVEQRIKLSGRSDDHFNLPGGG